MMRQVVLGALLVALATALPAAFPSAFAAHARRPAGKAVAKAAPKPAAPKITVTAPAAAGLSNDIASGVTPIGSPGDWFPIESYPPEARAASQEGRTQFSLDIDAAGRITGCNILESSGSDLLDSTTCSQLILNGRFKPAMDRSGKPMRGTWKSAMRWRLSDAEPRSE